MLQDAPVGAFQHTHLNREQILTATGRCLADRGYDQTTIRAIAGSLDCAVGSIYRYFDDKRELLFAVTQRMLEPVAQMIESDLPVQQTATAYFRVASENTASYRLMFWLASVTNHPVTVPPVIERVLSGWTRQLGTPARARALWSALHGLALLGEGPAALHELLGLHLGHPASTTDAARPAVEAEAPAPAPATVEPAAPVPA